MENIKESKNDMTFDTIIIGGGIIGLACAHYLNKNGLNVIVIEQEEIGIGASHGNCGLLYFSGIIPLCSPGSVSHELKRMLTLSSPLHIAPRVDIDLWLWLLKFTLNCNEQHKFAGSKAKDAILKNSISLFSDLFEQENFDCDFEKKGLLLLFNNRKYFKEYHETNRFLEKFNFQATSLEKERLLRLEPAINENVVGAWFNENDWHLRPGHLLQAWKRMLINKGVKFAENCKMTGFKVKNKKIQSIKTEKGELKAQNFVIATGAWSSKILKELNLNIPIQPGKGYSITMEKPDGAPLIPCYLYERNMVVTPWKTGYRLGGTMEFSGFNKKLNKKRLRKLISGAKEYLKTSVKNPIIEEWTGFRPMTHDDLPIIDRGLHQKNLYIAAGHGMLGLSMATGTGKAICDLMLGNPCDFDLEPFSLKRF